MKQLQCNDCAQYDSNISEPIPVTSPTLSPTLSAITPGFLDRLQEYLLQLFRQDLLNVSTFCKIPPPTLENKATDDAPIPNHE